MFVADLDRCCTPFPLASPPELALSDIARLPAEFLGVLLESTEESDVVPWFVMVTRGRELGLGFLSLTY